MNYTRLFVLAAVLFLLLACSAADVDTNDKFGPEYYAGRAMGEKYAKMDSGRINCTGLKPNPSSWSRRHNPELEEQGRSDIFKQGFYGGYRRILEENYQMKCQ